MWFRLLALALLLLPAPVLAGVKEKLAGLAPQAVVLVMDAEGNELVAQNVDQPFVPASVTKIVTAWLAMEVLGGDYRFETRIDGWIVRRLWSHRAKRWRNTAWKDYPQDGCAKSSSWSASSR